MAKDCRDRLRKRYILKPEWLLAIAASNILVVAADFSWCRPFRSPLEALDRRHRSFSELLIPYTSRWRHADLPLSP